MSQSGMTARPAEQNRGSDSVERLLGRFVFAVGIMAAIGIIAAFSGLPWLSGWCAGNCFVYFVHRKRFLPNALDDR
jgi:hypothetical protein